MLKKFFFLFLFIILSINTLAIGLRGTNLKDTFIFEPGITKQYDYKLITHSTTQDYEFYVRSVAGDENLTRHIHLSQEIAQDIPSGSVYPFTATLRLPPKIDTPGWHELRVGVRETQVEGGGAAGAKAASEARIIFLVLFPYKYIETSLSAGNANEGEQGEITITANNYGTKKINSLYADIKIFDKDNKLVNTLRTDTIELESKETGTLKATYQIQSVGDYQVNATIHYDENTIDNTGVFRVGELDIKINDYTKTFTVGTINKMIINVESGWNDVIKDLYAEIKIYNNESEIVAETKSANIDLKPFAQGKVESYLDFTELTIGEYKAMIDVFYQGNTKSDSSNIELIEPKKPVVEEPKQEPIITTTTLIMIVVGINVMLLLAVLSLLVFQKKK